MAFIRAQIPAPQAFAPEIGRFAEGICISMKGGAKAPCGFYSGSNIHAEGSCY